MVTPQDDDRDLSTAEDSDNRYYTGRSGRTPLTNGHGASSSSSAGNTPANSTTAANANNEPGGRSRYLALKERRTRLARSRSSHNLGIDDEDIDDDPPLSPTTASPSAYLASRCAYPAGMVGRLLFKSVSLQLNY